MNKYVAEFIGTFFLVLTVICAVNSDMAPAFHPIAIGTMLIGMIFAAGHISAAHFNPTVTLCLWMRGTCATKDIAGYVIAQLLASVLAAYVGGNILGKIPTEAATNMDILPAMVAETLGTFALVWVILNVATTKINAGNSFYGLAIGFTVTGCAYILGGYGSYGCFNPAVAIATLINGLNTVANIGPIIIANIIGGVLAVIAFKATYTE